ncbi:ArsR/SmtB family transcription factor [Streptomyces caelestis]|uniref:ArsR/SmtB family transcription factor n=1 Tax=Streptomyces caelestis TaxID=36816 RepID=UPI0036FD4211
MRLRRSPERTPGPTDVLSYVLRLRGVGGASQFGSPATTANLVEFIQVAVLPYWSQIRSHLEGIRDAGGRIIAANGLERLLNSLHAKLYWNTPVLEIRQGPDRTAHLDGRGLTLTPSFFLHDQSCVFIEHEKETGGPTVVFPVKAATKAEIWGAYEPDEQALGALVGHTRAAALQALTRSRTTSELAEQLGISLAGASKHAAVLRRSGLITTSRNRNTALHTLTELGTALLQIRGLSPVQPLSYDGLRDTEVPQDTEVPA